MVWFTINRGQYIENKPGIMIFTQRNSVGHENIAIWNYDIAIFFKNKQFSKIAILPYWIAVLPYSPKNQQISIIAILPYSLKI